MSIWKKKISLTLVAYLALLIFWIIFAVNNYKKLFTTVALVFFGYSIFNIVILLKIAYKFLRNKLGYKKKEIVTINQGEDFISNDTAKQQLIKNENTENEDGTKSVKKALGVGTGCVAVPIVGWFLFVSLMLIIMGLIGAVNSFIPPSWRSCYEVVIFKDPIAHSDSPFGKKGEVIYYKHGGGDLSPASCKILKNADFNTFKLLGGNYARDKNNAYIYRKLYKDDVVEILNGADVASFEYVGNDYAKDKNNIYYYGNVLPGADVTTFKLLEERYSRDKNNVYYYDNVLLGADVATFKILKNGYAKDRNNVYRYEGLLIGADASSFEVVGYLKNADGVQYDAKDKNNLYWFSNVVGINVDEK